MLYISDANRWQFWNGHGDTEGFWAQVNADERIVENTWHMQTVTYDHSATTMKLYVDGVFLEENTIVAMKMRVPPVRLPIQK